MNIVEALKKVKNELLDFVVVNLGNKSDIAHTHDEYADAQHVHSYNDLTDLPTNSGNADTATRKWRQVIDSRLSPWYLETNNIVFDRKSFESISIANAVDEAYNKLPVANKTEILLGSVTFIDCEYGYIVYDIPEIDGIHIESRCDDKVYELTNGYTINKNTNTLWDSDFKDKIHEIYLIIDKDIVFDDYLITITGLIYECMSMNDMELDSFEDYINFTKYERPNSYNNVTMLAESQTINGVTFTVQDNIVILNGTATDDIIYTYGRTHLYNRSDKNIIFGNVTFIDKTLTFTVSDRIWKIGLQVYEGNAESAILPGYYILDPMQDDMINDIYNPIVINNIGYPVLGGAKCCDCNIVILIKANSTFNNHEVYCKMTESDITLDDAIAQSINDTYELKSIVNNNFDNALTYNNSNILNLNTGTQTVNGLTITVSDDNLITINGTSTTYSNNRVTIGQLSSTYDDNYGFIIQDLALNSTNTTMELTFADDENMNSKYWSYFNKEPYHVKEKYKYINISIPGRLCGTKITNFKFKPVIYKCESVHEVLQDHLTNTSGSKTLTEHLSEESMTLSNLQYGDTLPDPGTPGRIFFKRVSN